MKEFSRIFTIQKSVYEELDCFTLELNIVLFYFTVFIELHDFRANGIFDVTLGTRLEMTTKVKQLN